jgi:hypothetical protein
VLRLARLEGRIAPSKIVRRFPNLEVSLSPGRSPNDLRRKRGSELTCRDRVVHDFLHTIALRPDVALMRRPPESAIVNTAKLGDARTRRELRALDCDRDFVVGRAFQRLVSFIDTMEVLER